MEYLVGSVVVSVSVFDNDSIGSWYVLQVRAGSEESIAKMITRDSSSPVLEVFVPSSQSSSVSPSSSRASKKKLFPGYVFLRMKGYNSDFGKVLSVSADIYKFLSSGDTPRIILDSQIDEMRSKLESGDMMSIVDTSSLHEGDSVKINDDGSPFDSFVGQIKSIDRESKRAIVSVVVFGKEISVDLDLSKVQESS